MEEDAQKALDLAIATLDKQFGKGSVIRLGSTEVAPWPALSSGSPSLDSALGIGGFPRGRIVEVFGPLGSSKSTLCLSVVAKAQEQNLTCGYIDVEHALDPMYMKALGVNVDELLISQPSCGEEALEILDRLVGTGAMGVIVVDSVAALTPRAELEGTMEDQQMGLQARMMGKALRKVVAKASDHKTLVIFTNQIRNKMSPYGNPETTPGGMALGFFSSVRIDLRKKEDLKSKADGSCYGIRVKAKVQKNKLAAPLKSAEFDVIYGKGIDTVGGIIDHAVYRGALKVVGSGWIKWAHNDETVARSREAVAQMYVTDPAFAAELHLAVERHVDYESGEVISD
jgi:recombination protein RecA